MASKPHDLLHRFAVLRQSQDGRIGLLAAQITLVLQALGGWEQFRIDRRRTNDGACLSHRFADGIKEMLGWHSPSDANDKRLVPHAAKPLPQLRHIHRHVIHQHEIVGIGAMVENANFRSSKFVRIDNGGSLPFGLMARNAALCCSPLPVSMETGS